jgi:16S rRNA processing protein RimM
MNAKTQSSSEAIAIGKFGKPFGILGWLRLHSETEEHGSILNYKPLFIKKGDLLEEIVIDSSKLHNKQLIVKIKSVNNPEEAAFLNNKTVFIYREQLPKLSSRSYYWADLEKLEVVNAKGIILGIVDHLFKVGKNDVLFIQGEKTYMIPFLLDQFILNVDLSKKKILVDWDENF